MIRTFFIKLFVFGLLTLIVFVLSNLILHVIFEIYFVDFYKSLAIAIVIYIYRSLTYKDKY